MPNRTNIPMKYLRHIAHQLITSTHEAKRTDKRRPRSKTAVLREMMKSDPKLAGKVTELYRQMQMDELRLDMRRDGLELRPVDSVAIEGRTKEADLIWLGELLDWNYLAHFTGSGASRCRCGQPVVTWHKGQYLCLPHAPRCSECSSRADYESETGNLLCQLHHDAHLKAFVEKLSRQFDIPIENFKTTAPVKRTPETQDNTFNT